ncbi:MAG: ADP-ribosylglycohydrolase family protein, partial [Ramlibacter sp.]|nr:ADP-ribosylglycohydrolase family protein [Ramlibacter sp.]
MHSKHEQQVISSALWAAYGDALGFQTELAGPSLVRQRTGSQRVTELVPWRRMIGGKFAGTYIDLPIGTYSDDTQLRLAVCRSIQSAGAFDIEAFAKIELPVWLAYALGGGRGTKAAATALTGRNTNWFTNFFKGNTADYIAGGGNGAAMRIQPHVWAAGDLRNERAFMVDVVRNSISTHGHLRAIGGAMIHASLLAYVMRESALPQPSEWMDFAEVIQGLPEVVEEIPELRSIWLPTWQQQAKTTLDAAVVDAADEWAHSVGASVSLLEGDPVYCYRSI